MENNIVYYIIVQKDCINIDSITDKAQYILKCMLDYFNIKFPKIFIAEKGKPYFKDSDIFFNYSHSNNFIACAISNCEVGIDIEEKSRVISDRVSKKYLDNEIDSQKRIEKWVRKEAYSKLKGLGLSIKFQSINLQDLTEKNILINEKDYICSIYSDNSNVIFKDLKFNGEKCYE